MQKYSAMGAQDSRADKLDRTIALQGLMKAASDPNADYRIGKEDVLEIDVYQAEELRRTVRVSSQGFIGLPLLGQIQAKGSTTSELEKEIAQKYDRYLESPLVSVYVKEYKAQRIGVIGAVKSPQVYVVTGQRYLIEMLSMAGGLTPEAGPVGYIVRPLDDKPGSPTQTLAIDLSELLEKGNLDLNIPVFSGDVINVPKGGVVFVDGAVEKPGAFNLSSRMTLMQVIAMAGGMKFEAHKGELKLYRPRTDGTQEVINIDYNAVRDGLKEDIALKQNDIVVVPTDGFKSVLTGFGGIFRGAIGMGSGTSFGLGR